MRIRGRGKGSAISALRFVLPEILAFARMTIYIDGTKR
jgi:hypothetical protein